MFAAFYKLQQKKLTNERLLFNIYFGLSREILLLSEIEKSGLIFSVFCTLIVPSNRR